MTDYEQVKAEIQSIRDEGYREPLDEVDALWTFINQLQDIIESANTEPPEYNGDDYVWFRDLARGDRFRVPPITGFEGDDTVYVRVSPGGLGYEPEDNPGALRFMPSSADVVVVRA